MKRVFAISDIHVDYKQNMDWVDSLSGLDFRNDTLVVAGDISNKPLLFSKALECLQKKFENVAFVPGNHDLWVRGTDSSDSMEKFYLLNNICEVMGIKTRSFLVKDRRSVQIQPLFSWYTKPEQGEDSLYLAKPGEDPNLSMWADNKAIKWPSMNGFRHPAEKFINMNEWQHDLTDEFPVITFTHFLPRQELIFGLANPSVKKKFTDPFPAFNFSRVAGSVLIDRQLRNIGSSLHIFGHQHRNRQREIDGVTYIAQCLAYPKERHWAGIKDDEYFPKLVWDSENGFVKEPEY
ncbi:MAG: metallophosphoesterase [Calditrichaeota bacterium]|nr:metallophosphoesterase [Calditrichota bacterium]